jgi:hypothetical protein
MVWEIDPETGAIVAEGSILGHAAPVTCLAVCGLEAEGFEVRHIPEILLWKGSARVDLIAHAPSSLAANS